MQVGYDVVVVGAGPVGITTACTLKAIHSDLRICVIDKRPEPQRNHGLKIKSDSINKIQNILEEVLKTKSTLANSQDISGLKYMFEKWRNGFIRTNQIEKDLADIAGDMGIIVLRDKICEISEKNLPFLCADSLEFDDLICSDQLKNIFKNARVVIGADGAHSVVRKVVMQDEFSYQETLRHILELKYQSSGQMQNRGFSEASRDVIKHSALSFETTGKDNKSPTKPVTYHLSINKIEYDSLRVEVDGKLKGVFGNSWTLVELEQLAKNDEKVKHTYVQITDYLKDISFRKGECKNEKISTLSLSIYRSKDIVKKYNDKYVLLVGDAESGLILERGFNKGIVSAGHCAKAVSLFFQENLFAAESKNGGDEPLPQMFQNYEKCLLTIFENERKWANLKNYSLAAVESSLNPSRKVSESFSYMVEEGKMISSAPVLEWPKRISTKVFDSDASRVFSDASSLLIESGRSTCMVEESKNISSSSSSNCVIS